MPLPSPKSDNGFGSRSLLYLVAETGWGLLPSGFCTAHNWGWLAKGAEAMRLADIVQRGWEAVGAGDFDALVADYTDDMVFIMPGQDNRLEGRAAFRAALDKLGEILPPGFEITGLRQIEGDGEVVSIVGWQSDKVAESMLTVLFRFKGDKVFEERWFIDTEQWKGAF